MARHLVFLVHGMGAFERNWSLDAQKTLKAAFDAYPFAKRVANRFEFVEVNYNEFFEQRRQQWKSMSTSLLAELTGAGLADSAAGKLARLATVANPDDFLRTHVLDVVMYRFLKPVAEQINQSVRQQILSRLAAAPPGMQPEWSVLAHSLGTAVVNETLHAMFTEPVDGRMLPDAFKPDFILMVANVSKVLWKNGGDFYSTKVRPHPVTSLGMCWRYCNFRHELDVFTRVDRFRPPDYWYPEDATPALRDSVYADVELGADDIQDVNVHGLTHYLSHPDVHVPLINTLVGAEAISPSEQSAARTAWRKARPGLGDRNALKGALKAIPGASSQNWSGIIDLLTDFRNLVENQSELRDGERP